jgi:hypothetical protein
MMRSGPKRELRPCGKEKQQTFDMFLEQNRELFPQGLKEIVENSLISSSSSAIIGMTPKFKEMQQMIL